MIRLNFQINLCFLVYHILVNTSPSRFIPGARYDHIVDFQNLAWTFDKEAYSFLQGHISRLEPHLIAGESLTDIGRRADKLLAEMANHPSFKQLQQETSDALAKVRAEWEEDYAEASAVMQEITGLTFDKPFDVLITHPAIKTGNAGPPIGWTYRLDFPHYNTVYLWHEIMHSYLPSDSPDRVSNIEHAVIELATDNELRVRLGGGTYPPLVGHPQLKPLKERLLPSWRQHLQEKRNDIYEYLRAAKQA